MADDVQLTDLEVIQRYSLAVRRATAPRAELIASLQADLEWLGSARRTPAPAAAPVSAAPVMRAVTQSPAEATQQATA